MICPVCEQEKGEDLIQIHPIYEDYMCYECLPDSIREQYDNIFNKSKQTQGSKQIS